MTGKRASKIFAVGDIQGCCDQLDELYQQISAQYPQARLLFAGDLVNRGPRSLATLRFVHHLATASTVAQADTVLGNHDLHLLAVANGLQKIHRGDTLDDILQAPDKEALLQWLRHRPLALHEDGHLLVHAGVFPQWTVQQTLDLAQEVEEELRGPNWLNLLEQMYGNSPAQWNDKLRGMDRWRCIINAFTRMRFCSADGVMDFDSKDGVGAAPAGMMPWFDVPGRKTATTPVIFGHWSTLGLVLRPDLLSLDTGCVWGGKLTAVALDDRQIVQIDCPQHRQPG
ncbi:symmetrical bis(5'-nucleosyl)-tetraphosphatase [Undibacterium terreum]|uniref:Bis(5'-nucleosyl)-tetraphosphatase, symmetrical n=1 Tax=Undibacterium terreum TaxID=1224302 RepID=A0A916UPY1_9BURK|nr:symmetrical bis(5'-nucleosyl)-tetraphosphatase [Undibacterium terreum]GGC82577.1 bis(5'-nucleosyl)-tetraphosphatase, symmetrical [Undibacterium terreum]